MFIRTENTPNENSIKFILEQEINQGKDILCKKTDNKNDFFDSFFIIEGINEVLIGKSYIVINKEAEIDWAIIKPQIISTIIDFFLNNKSFQFNEEKNQKTKKELDLSNETIKKIYDIIEDKIAPAIESDGGFIELIDFKDNIVYIKLGGACSGCSLSDVTLKDGIERLLKYYVKEIESVEKID